MPWSNQAVSLIVLVEAATGFSGLFGYSPVPGHGNLVFSIAAAAGTDPFGNAYYAGIATYGPAIPAEGIPAIVESILGTQLTLRLLSGAASEASPAELLANVINPGAPNESVAVALFGPESTAVGNDRAYVQLSSSGANAPGLATGFLIYAQASLISNRLAWGRLGLSRYSTGGINGGVPLHKIDTFARTVSTIGVQPLTVAWPLPANDVVSGLEGTTYHLTMWGTGTWGNPSVSPTQWLQFGGANFQLFPAAGFITAGHAFSWYAELNLTIATVGVAAQVNIGGWSFFTDAVTFAGAGPAVFAGTTVVDTTSPTTLAYAWDWPAGPNGSTITCAESIFERIEP